MKVSVVILNWNGKKMLEAYLPSVCTNSLMDDVEVVVADNGSTDDSVSFLEQNYPQVKTLVFDKNYGFAEGYNKALSMLDAEYFVLLNSDVEVTKGWLLPLIQYMDENSEVAACQPKIRSISRRSYFEHAGACGGFIDKYGFPFCRGRIFDVVEEDKGQYDSIKDIFWATGAALFIRSDVYKEVGGLDGTFFAHMEEIDLCWRLRSRNKRIVCIPESLVFHVGGGTLSAENPRKTYLNFRNNLLMIYKNATDKQLSKLLLSRFFFDNVAAFQYLLKGDTGNFKAVRKARNEFRKIQKDYRLKREENLSKMVIDIIPEVYNKSIVLEFFLKKKRLFSNYLL